MHDDSGVARRLEFVRDLLKIKDKLTVRRQERRLIRLGAVAAAVGALNYWRDGIAKLIIGLFK